MDRDAAVLLFKNSTGVGLSGSGAELELATSVSIGEGQRFRIDTLDITMPES